MTTPALSATRQLVRELAADALIHPAPPVAALSAADREAAAFIARIAALCADMVAA